jgi:hypothetical protein
MYEADAKGAWSATPLRKALRHRRGSEKSPESSSELVSEEKARSDSCITALQPQKQIPKQLTEDRTDAAPKRGVLSIISKYEQIQKQKASPQMSRAKAPLAVSQTKRLKTAEELLNDSSQREKLPSVSSDKENDKQPSKVLRMIQRFSVESSEDSRPPSRAGSQERPVRPLHSTSPTASPSSKPLKDVTNDSKSQTNSPQTAIRQRTIEAKIEFLLAGSTENVKRESPAPSPHASPLHMRSAKLTKQTPNSPVSELGAPVWQLQEKSSPSPVHRERSATIPQPGPPAKTPKGKGAISALCMQTMNFGAQPGGMAASGESSSPREKKKSKFLDGYRKFFKVAK